MDTGQQTHQPLAADHVRPQMNETAAVMLSAAQQQQPVFNTNKHT